MYICKLTIFVKYVYASNPTTRELQYSIVRNYLSQCLLLNRQKNAFSIFSFFSMYVAPSHRFMCRSDNCSYMQYVFEKFNMATLVRFFSNVSKFTFTTNVTKITQCLYTVLSFSYLSYDFACRNDSFRAKRQKNNNFFSRCIAIRLLAHQCGHTMSR